MHLPNPDARTSEEVDTPSVGALVVTWNRRDDVLECLASLARNTYPRLRTYVVDNASSDGTSDAIRREFPDAVLIRSETNLGFSGGNNLGMERMLRDGTDSVFLLNDDAVIAEDGVSQLIEGGYGDTSIGVLASKIYLHSEPDVLWSTGGIMDPRTAVTTQRNYQEKDIGQADSPNEIDYAVGCAMLVKSEVVKRVGALDTRYFMYYEETDWCHRIRGAGYRILYVPGSRVWHKVAPNGRGESAYYYARNRLLYLRQCGASPAWVGWIAMSDIVRSAVVHAARGRGVHSRLILRGVKDFYSGVFGKLASSS